MKNEEIKTIWKLAKSFLILGFSFWMVETLIFLIYEGWHFKATNPTEIYLDKFAGTLITFALNLTTVCFVYLIININKKD